MARARMIKSHFMFSRSMRAVSRMARPAVSHPDSGATKESFGSDSEKPSDAKASTPSRETSRPIREPQDSLGENPQNLDGPGLSRGFPSDSGGASFFRRAAAAHRALTRVG
jgi:hypothetical protein